MFASRRATSYPSRFPRWLTGLAGLFLLLWAMANAPAAHATVTLGAIKTISNVAAAPGGTVTYFVQVFNTSNTGSNQPDNNAASGGASTHEFTDTLPAQLTLVSATAVNPNNNNPYGTITTSGNTVNWDGVVAGYNNNNQALSTSVNIRIKATINPGTGGQTVSNQGTVSYSINGTATNDTTTLTDGDTNTAGIQPTTFTVQNDTLQPGPNYIVNTTADHDDTVCGVNDCTLREAINAIDNFSPVPAASSIGFNIPAGQANGGVFTIAFSNANNATVPQIFSFTNNTLSNLTIDGNTEAAFLGIATPTHPIVVLSGGNGSTLVSLQNVANSTVKNLAFSQFSGYAIAMSNNSANNTVQGCYIGTNATGTTKTTVGSITSGIQLNANGNTIGGTTAATRNVISGTTNALSISGNNNSILGNYIGTDATGSSPIPNTAATNGIGVIYVTGTGNVIGGAAAGAGNLISGNTGGGVVIQSNTNLFQGNRMGVNASGTGPLPNFFSGTNSADVTVGGNGNIIGLDSTGAGAGNIIANGSGEGVYCNFGTGNVIRGNSIYNNNGVGIDLASGNIADGPTANDASDVDTGPNNLQNFPVLTAATAVNSGSTTVSGALNSNPNTSFIIDFYAGATADPSGFGQGKYYLGSTPVTTDGAGNVTFTNVALPGVTSDVRFITATTTRVSPTTGTGNLGDTSEFSQDVALGFAVANSDTATTAEDTATDINVLANDSGSGTLAITAITQGTSGGTVTLNQNGTVHYVPAANFSGTDTFTYTISNGAGSTSTTVVTVTVTAVNDAPVNTVPGAQSVNEDTSLVFFSAGNNALSVADVDANGAAEEVSLSVTNGTLSLSGTTGLTFSLGTGTANPGMTFQGTLSNINAALAGLTYTPAANFSGPATLTISTNDLGNTGAGGAKTATSTVAITVLPDNDPPVAANDAYAVTSSSLSVLAPGVLGNDTDIDSPVLTAVLVTNPTHGSVTLNADGSFTYTPVIGYNGADSFTYEANDGVANSNVATVTLTVSGNISQTVTLTLANNSVAEGQSAIGLLTLSRPSAVATTVTLSSSQTGATPTTVTIAAGQTTALVSLKTLSNPLATGPQTVTITANAGAYGAATASLIITDNEVPTLTLTVAPTSVSENYGPVAAVGTVTRNTPTTQPLAVALSSNSKAAKVPATVVIPAGASAATFVIAAVDNRIVNQPQTVQLKAHSANYQDGLATLTVTDNGKVTQDLKITLATGNVYTERAGGQTVTGTVSLSGKPLTKNLIITLVSTDAKRVVLPASVLLKAGQSSVNFSFRILDNTVADGPHSVWLVARAAGFGTSALLVTVQDNDGPILSLTLSKPTAAATVMKLTGTVTRLHVPITTALVVTLTSSDKTRVTVPPTVTIPAGKTVATFTVTIKHSTLATVTHTVTITASKAGLVSGSAVLAVQDIKPKPAALEAPAPRSTIALSTATAGVNGLQLRFLGALDVDSALDAEHYTVTVNGTVVAVESVAYAAASHSVTLTVGEGGIQAGDTIVVQWQGLQDKQGRTLSGTTESLTAH